MAQEARKQDESRLASELTKNLQRDRSKLERAYAAMEESGDTDAFLQSLVDATTEASQDIANDNQSDNRQRITPNQPRSARKQRKPKRATRKVSAKPKQTYQPFNLSPEENPPLIEDDSLSSGIYPDETDAQSSPDQTSEIQERTDPQTEEQYASTLAKDKQAQKKAAQNQRQLSRAEAFARKHDIEKPIELEQKAQNIRGQVASEGQKFGQALKKRIDEGDFKSFAIALSLAIFKDIIDIPEQSGLVSGFVNVFVTATLYVIIRGEYGFVQRMMRKYFYRRIWIMFFAELIPGIKFIPIMTLFILSMNRKIQKEKQKNILALRQWKVEQQKILRSPLFRKQQYRTRARQATSRTNTRRA